MPTPPLEIKSWTGFFVLLHSWMCLGRCSFYPQLLARYEEWHNGVFVHVQIAVAILGNVPTLPGHVLCYLV